MMDKLMYVMPYYISTMIEVQPFREYPREVYSYINNIIEGTIEIKFSAN